MYDQYITCSLRWFQGFDWDGLLQRKLIPPIIPQVSWLRYFNNSMFKWYIFFELSDQGNKTCGKKNALLWFWTLRGKFSIISPGLQVKGPSDYSNFDSYPRSSEVPPDETSGWDFDFWKSFRNTHQSERHDCEYLLLSLVVIQSPQEIITISVSSRKLLKTFPWNGFYYT